MKFKVDYTYAWPAPAEMTDQYFSQVVEAWAFYETMRGSIQFTDDTNKLTHLFTGVLKVEAVGE